MAFFKHHHSLSLAIFFLCISISSCSRNPPNSDLIHQQCDLVHQFYTPFPSNRCVEILSAEPKALNAKDVKTLAIVGLELFMKNTTEIIARINAAIASNSTNPELKTVLKNVAGQLQNAYHSFWSALGEVKEGDEADTANYDCAVVSDDVRIAKMYLKEAKEAVDPFYEASIDRVSDFGFICYTLTNNL